MNCKLILICDQDEQRALKLASLTEGLGYEACYCEPDSPHLNHLPLPFLILLGRNSSDSMWETDRSLLENRFPGTPVVATGDRSFGQGASDWQRNLMAIIDPCLDESVLPPVGISGAMQSLHAAIEHLAVSDLSVLVTGESGTGKRHVARRIHELSGRVGKPFVTVDCETTPANLLELELYGQRAHCVSEILAGRKGQVERAEGGTLFLSGISNAPPSVQLKLMRSMENRAFRRVDGKHDQAMNVRVIAATNKKLATAVTAGSFRKDLYFRLSGFPLHVPALRDRTDDISHLIDALGYELRRQGLPRVFMSQQALVRLKAYRWPGNVRELADLMEDLSVRYPDQVIAEEQLPKWIRALASNPTRTRDRDRLPARVAVG